MWTCTWDRSELKMSKGDFNWELESFRELSSKLILFCVYMYVYICFCYNHKIRDIDS